MANRAEKLFELKSLISSMEGYRERERLPCETLSCGIPRGAITEISGTARVEWLSSFLKQHEGLKVFWLEKRLSLFPTAIAQLGVNPSRFTIAEGGETLLPILRKVIRSQAFECVASPSIFREVRELHSLQLMSERANTCTFLFTEELKIAWPITLQFEVNRGSSPNSLDIRIKKNKGGDLTAKAEAL